MLRPLSLIIVAFFYLVTGYAHGVEPVRVLIFPFKINAQEDMAYLGSEIPETIKAQLARDGAIILDPEPLSTKSLAAMGGEDFRSIGKQTGADYVIWGSMTRIGQQFSIDAKIVDVFGEGTPQAVFKEGTRIETLPVMVKELTDSLGKKVFKHAIIAEILVEGNKRIEADAVKRVIKAAPGDVFSAQDLSRDLKTVYAMGYFDDVRIEAEDGSKGRTVIFRVTEKPTTRLIRFKGNKVFDDEKLTENLSLRTGSILNAFQLEKNVKRIETLYREKNYHNVQVTYQIHPLENDQADLEFVIDEGRKIWIRAVAIEGNSAYSEKKIKKLMKTKEKGFMSWITSSGDLNQEDLDQDAERVAAFYNNNGYIVSKVGEPQIEFKADGIYITLKVDEGPRFKVGKVDISGETVLPKEELIKKLKITQQEYYSREVVRSDVLGLTDLYSDMGYAYADILPRTEQDFDNLEVMITYTVDKGKQVRFERISIEGNTKTRDKVIRRQLNLYEQDLFSGAKLKTGIQNLHRLDYFEDVKVNTEKGSSDDTMLLNINVAEKPTGTFSFGGGYSADESVFGMATINQRNLFGRGQTLELKAELGGRTNRFTLSFVEPWFLDRPLSAGFDLYNWNYSYDEYDKDALGGRLRIGYPVYNHTMASLAYIYEIDDVRNISFDASKSIKALEGKNTLSSLEASLRRDSRNKAFNATRGSINKISVEYAGLGGDIAFTKVLGNSGWLFPIVFDWVGFVHGAGGYVTENSGGILPDYEKFYLGGVNSIRGYEWRSIYLEDEDGAAVGGDKFIQFNLELHIPLLKKAGVMGVLFYDTGNVYGENETIDFSNLRKGAGAGVRWYSPIGPIRIEYGFILDPIEGDDSNGRWEFAMGAPFN